jgi:hypothetical protein
MTVAGAVVASVVVLGTWLRFAVQPVLLAFEVGRWLGKWEERRVQRKQLARTDG